MNIVPAKIFDIPEILKIERASFIPAIQETPATFQERLEIFPQGFLLLQDTASTAIEKNGHSVAAGYFTSEIWNFIPKTDDFFALNHSSKKLHNPNGTVLYVSSFALFPEYRGKGLAQSFFKESLNSICRAFPDILTVLLLVNEEWKGACRIYEKNGFTQLRKIEKFFPSLHNVFSDGILMTASANLFR